MTPLPVTLEELYMLIGEREVIRYKQQEKIKELLIQADEMSKKITELRTQLEQTDGKLGESAPNNAV